MLHSLVVIVALAATGQSPAQGPTPDQKESTVTDALRSPPIEPSGDPPGDPNDRPLDDPTVPGAGDIEPDLSIIDRNPPNWLHVPPDKEWLNAIRDPLQSLDEKYGLAITGAYTVLFQQSIGPNAQSAAGGDFDLSGRWTLLGRDTPDTGSFYTNVEYRHEIGDNPPSALGGEIGTLLATTNGFNNRGWAVKDAYWAQRLFDDHFRFGIGRADPENLVGNYRLQSANTAFLNKAFSTNPTIAFPGSGAAAAFSLRPVEWFYWAAGATNAYGVTTQSTIDLLDEWRLFEFTEFGFTPTIEGLGEGRYRVALWHMDSRELTDQPSDGGFSIIIDQEIGERVAAFARYGYADGDLTNVRQSVQGGAGFTGLFGSSADLTGLAIAWSEPVDGSLRDEKVLEVFHRLQLTGRTQLTLGMQLIVDPSNAPDVDALGVFSCRFRLSF